MWRIGLAVPWMILALAGCSDPPFIDPPNPLPGQITTVNEATFVVTTPTGERYEFVNANPEDEGMGQAHMRVHLADRTPVLVTWRRDGYDLVAVKIGDGTMAPSPAVPTTPVFPQSSF